MFDKFGEFDSAEELNKAAEGLKEEGDKESLIELAKENGIDPEDTEDYWKLVRKEHIRVLSSGRNGPRSGKTH